MVVILVMGKKPKTYVKFRAFRGNRCALEFEPVSVISDDIGPGSLRQIILQGKPGRLTHN